MAGDFKEAFKESYKSIVDRIISAMDCDEDEDFWRIKVERFLSASCRKMAKPVIFEELKAASIYKYANVVLDSKTYEDYLTRLSDVVAHTSYSIGKFLSIMDPYPWKYKFKFPFKFPKMQKENENKEKIKEVKEFNDNDMRDQAIRILIEQVDVLSKQVNDLENKFYEMEELFKVHAHIGGRLYKEIG